MRPIRFLDPREAAFESVRRWWRAWAEKDLAAVGRMVGPGYSERTATRGIRAMELEQLMEEARQCCKRVSIASWELTEPVTKLYEQVVVCSYAFHLSGTRDGRPFTFKGRATDVLSRRGDDFVLVSHHGTLDLGRGA